MAERGWKEGVLKTSSSEGVPISASPWELVLAVGLLAGILKARLTIGRLRWIGDGDSGLGEPGEGGSSDAGMTLVDPSSIIKSSEGGLFRRCHDMEGRCSSSPGRRESCARSPDGASGFLGGVLLLVKILSASLTEYRPFGSGFAFPATTSLYEKTSSSVGPFAPYMTTVGLVGVLGGVVFSSWEVPVVGSWSSICF